MEEPRHPHASAQSSGTISPIPKQPPEQERQSRNPWQTHQESTRDDPPAHGVSQRKAVEGKEIPDQQVFTPASTIDELIKAAYFVAASIDAPVVDPIDQHRLNLHYPADGSLVTIRVEGRPGAWGGIGPLSDSPEEDADRNAAYDEAKAIAEAPPPPPEGGAAAAKSTRGDLAPEKHDQPQNKTPKAGEKHGGGGGK